MTMGWQDAPLLEEAPDTLGLSDPRLADQPSWMSAPMLSPEQQPGLRDDEKTLEYKRRMAIVRGDDPSKETPTASASARDLGIEVDRLMHVPGAESQVSPQAIREVGKQVFVDKTITMPDGTTTEPTHFDRMQAAMGMVRLPELDADDPSMAVSRAASELARSEPGLRQAWLMALGAKATKASFSIANGDTSAKNYIAVAGYLEEARKVQDQYGKMPWYRKTVEGIAQTLEFASGLVGGRPAAEAGRKMVTRGGAGLARRLAGEVVGETARLAVSPGLAMMAAEGTIERMAPRGEGTTELVPGDPFLEALPKAIGSQLIAQLTERSGGALVKLPGIKQLKNVLAKGVGRIPGAVRTAAEWDGILGEWGEERLEELAQGIFSGVTGDGFQFGPTADVLSGDPERMKRGLGDFAVEGLVLGAVGAPGIASDVSRTQARRRTLKPLADKWAQGGSAHEAVTGKKHILDTAIPFEGVIAWSLQEENAKAATALMEYESPSREQWRQAGLVPAEAPVRQQFVRDLHEIKEIQDAGSVRSPEEEVRQTEGGPPVRGAGEIEGGAVQPGEVAPTQDEVTPETPEEAGRAPADRVVGEQDAGEVPAEETPVVEPPVQEGTGEVTPPVQQPVSEPEEDVGKPKGPEGVTPPEVEVAKQPWEMKREEYRVGQDRVAAELEEEEGTPYVTVRRKLPQGRLRWETYDATSGKLLTTGASISGPTSPVAKLHRRKGRYVPVARQLGDIMLEEGETFSVDLMTELLQEQDADTHRLAVTTALEEGKPVPPEVLADYPDLVPEEASTPEGQQEQTPTPPQRPAEGPEARQAPEPVSEPEAAPEAARETEATTESPWADETKQKLQAVPAFEGSEIDLDEAAGTARITRPDGRATTVHLDADTELAAIAKKKGLKPTAAKGAYVYKTGKKGKFQEGDIYIRSDAKHDTLNHEAVHWLEDEGVITPEEVERFGGREPLAKKYGAWAANKQRKPETVFQRIYDFLEPMFSSQRRFFEDVGKRGTTPSPEAKSLPKAVGESVEAAEAIPDATSTMTAGEIVEVPTAEIGVDPKRFQFKSGASTKGVVEPLEGEWNPLAAGVVLLWEDKQGKKWAVNGHHRVELAEKKGVQKLDARVVRQADGVTAKDARILGAELNILEGQGTIDDYADFFRNTEIPEAEARKVGLLARAKGQTGFLVGQFSSEDVWVAYRGRKLSAEKAAAIADVGRGDEALQSAGLKQAKKGDSADEIRYFLQSLKNFPRGKAERQGDLFGFDDSAIQEAAKLSKAVGNIVHGKKERLLAVKGALRRPEQAKAMGLSGDYESIQKEANDIEEDLARWSQWTTDAALVREARDAAGLPVKESVRKEEPPTGKQGNLFSKKGLPGQKNLFADTGVPDDMVASAPEAIQEPASQGIPPKASKPTEALEGRPIAETPHEAAQTNEGPTTTATTTGEGVSLAISEELAKRQPQKRSARAAEQKEAAKQRFLEAGRRLIDPSAPTMGLNPSKVKDAVDMTLAAIDYGIATFDELVSLAVESFGERGVRDLSPYLEEAARQTGITGVTPVSEVLSKPKHPEEVAEEEKLPGGDDLTSIKKAVVNELRAMAGLPEMEGSTPQAVEEWAETARLAMSADPKAGIRLVNELANGKESITQHDAMLLQFRYRQLANELEPAVDEYVAAVKSKDPVAIAAAEKEVRERRGAMTEFEEIIHPFKETWGRTGVALQQLLRKDFSLEAILRRGQEANHGEELSPEQTAELTKLSRNLDDLQKRFDEQRRKTEDLERELASKQQHDEVVRKPQRTKERTQTEARQKAEKRVSDAWSNFTKALTGRVGSGVPLDLLPQAIEVASAYVELGVVRFSEFMAHVRRNVKAPDESLFRRAWQQVAPEVAVPELNMADRAALTKEARRIQRMLVETGIVDREQVIDTVHESMAEALPDFTRRQAMDALSGYGQFQMQSQEEIDKLIRDMNAEVLKLSQIDQQEIALRRVEQLRSEGKTDKEIGDTLASENLLVEATGLVRDDPTETVRQLTKTYNENKKGIPATTEGRAGLLQSAISAIERTLTNRIQDLNWEITHGEKIVREKRERPTTASIKELETERDRLQKIHREMFPPQRKPLTSEQRLTNAIKAADRTIAQLDKQLETMNFDRPPGLPPVSSAELEARRARIQQLRAERDAAKEMELARWEGEGGGVAIDPTDARARKIYTASLRRRIADYQQILANGDFSPKQKKVPRQLSQSELKLKRQMEDVRHEVLRKYAEYHLAHLHGIVWGLDKAAEMAHLSRAIMTSFDLSALLRQGGLAALGHPDMARRALIETVASIAHTFDSQKAKALLGGVTLSNAKEFLQTIDSRQAEFDFMHKLTQGPEGEFRLRAGLELPRTDEAVTRQEEVFQGRWGQHVPGIAISSRLYTMILNKMRADLFDIMVQHLGRNGQVSMAEAKVLAGFVNIATGRSDFGNWKGWDLNKAAAVLNTIFFAPRYVASRFQYMAMPFYLPLKGGIKQNWRVKRAIYKEYGRTTTGLATVLGAFALVGQLFWDDDDDNKPTVGTSVSTDFFKVKIGETRLDFLAGLSQVFVLSARMAPYWLGGGRTTSSVSGKTRVFGEGYNAPTRGTVLAHFARSKLAPVPGFITNGLNNWENVVGQKKDRLMGYRVHPAVGSAAEMFFPLSVRDVGETMRAHGIPATMALSVLAILGVSMNTYGPKTEYMGATPEERKTLLDKYINRMTWEDGLPAYSEFLTGAEVEKVYEQQAYERGQVLYNATASAPDRKRCKNDKTYQMAVEKHERALEEFHKFRSLHAKDMQDAVAILRKHYRKYHGSITKKGRVKPEFNDRLKLLARLYRNQ